MKEVYLAYFDYLGFKDFVENNEDDELIRRMMHVFRDIETALGQGEYIERPKGFMISDLSNSNINCLNISDTVLFWTERCDYKSLRELIKVAYDFNWKQNVWNMPIRGSIVKGKIHLVSGQDKSNNEALYSVQCLFGKGLIKAHDKAESQDWAGTVIDESVIVDLEKESDGLSYLAEYALKYKVPYKADLDKDSEYVLKLAKEMSNEAGLNGRKNDIRKVFEADNKSTSPESVQKKIENTLEFIEYQYNSSQEIQNDKV